MSMCVAWTLSPPKLLLNPSMAGIGNNMQQSWRVLVKKLINQKNKKAGLD